MKIAFLNIYNGVVSRGSEVFVHELSNELAKNHEVHVYQSGHVIDTRYKVFQIKYIPLISHQSSRVFRIFYEQLYYLLVFVFTLWCLPSLLKEKYDLIIPINGRWQVVICRLVRAIRKSKILISGHSGVGFDDWFNLIIGKPDIFISLTSSAEQWAKSKSSASKIFVIPNGVNTQMFRPEGKKKRLSLSEPIILCVGALIENKQVELLVRAVEKMKSGSLLLIGDGPLREEIQEFGNTCLTGRFTLIPYVRHEELPEYYRAANVFSLPAFTHEAFGLTYLESLACNTPVVAPNDMSKMDIIGEGGLTCEVKNSDSYALALEKACKLSWADKPRVQAEKFSWSNIAKKYEKAIASS